MSHASVARALPFLLPWTVLNDLFPSVEHFQVAPQLIMAPLSLDPPYRTLFYTVLKHAQPVFFIEVRPYSDLKGPENASVSR